MAEVSAATNTVNGVRDLYLAQAVVRFDTELRLGEQWDKTNAGELDSPAYYGLYSQHPRIEGT